MPTVVRTARATTRPCTYQIRPPSATAFFVGSSPVMTSILSDSNAARSFALTKGDSPTPPTSRTCLDLMSPDRVCLFAHATIDSVTSEGVNQLRTDDDDKEIEAHRRSSATGLRN